MAHVLILGMTLSGKTSLAKQLVPIYRKSGLKSIVLDPLCDPSWGADFQTSDPDEFLRVLWNSKHLAAFVDEGGDTVGRYDKAMERTATRGRHWGHRMHYLSQRGSQLSRTVRDQCSTLFLFCTAQKDAKLHAEEWNREELASAHTLRQGEYFKVGRFSELQRGKLF